MEHADLLLRAFRRTIQKSRTSIVAWVILPDHFHMLVNAPDGRVDKFIHLVKLSFTYQLKSRRTGIESVWQHRYWDHIIRSEQDLNHHIDYIHINPVKHGLCADPAGWLYSSFGRFKRRGHYTPDWGKNDGVTSDASFGE
jgi:putative transposase